MIGERLVTLEDFELELCAGEIGDAAAEDAVGDAAAEDGGVSESRSIVLVWLLLVVMPLRPLVTAADVLLLLLVVVGAAMEWMDEGITVVGVVMESEVDVALVGVEEAEGVDV